MTTTRVLLPTLTTWTAADSKQNLWPRPTLIAINFSARSKRTIQARCQLEKLSTALRALQNSKDPGPTRPWRSTLQSETDFKLGSTQRQQQQYCAFRNSRKKAGLQTRRCPKVDWDSVTGWLAGQARLAGFGHQTRRRHATSFTPCKSKHPKVYAADERDLQTGGERAEFCELCRETPLNVQRNELWGRDWWNGDREFHHIDVD